MSIELKTLRRQLAVTQEELGHTRRRVRRLADRIEAAEDLLIRYGTCRTTAHLQWLVDQVARALNDGDDTGYDQLLAEAAEVSPTPPPWSEGRRPVREVRRLLDGVTCYEEAVAVLASARVEQDAV